MRFVFTGPAIVKGIHFERMHLIALAHEKGHTVEKKVTPDTHYLVKGDIKKVTQKVMAASTTGASVITPEDFLKLMDFL